MYELLRREPGIAFDPEIAHAGLVYDAVARKRLATVHRSYIDIARRQGFPIVVLTDTWRASAERIARSRFAGKAVNEDNVAFLHELRESVSDEVTIAIAGLTGPRGDAYQPAEAPGRLDARRVHGAQVEALAAAGVDLLLAATLPSVEEARGIADVMSGTRLPFVLSFVVRPSGVVLDGTPLGDAIRRIDDETTRPPAGFAINCVHPSVFEAAMSALARFGLAGRVIWFQANTSDKSPEAIDGSETLEEGDPVAYASALAACGRRFGTRVLGGCCGSDVRHIEELAGRVG